MILEKVNVLLEEDHHEFALSSLNAAAKNRTLKVKISPGNLVIFTLKKPHSLMGKQLQSPRQPHWPQLMSWGRQPHSRGLASL